MSDHLKTSQYAVGGLAVTLSMMTEEEYQKSCVDHFSLNDNTPYEEFLILNGYLTKEQISNLKAKLDISSSSDKNPF